MEKAKISASQLFILMVLFELGSALLLRRTSIMLTTYTYLYSLKAEKLPNSQR
jgi:hypothetical protein